MSNENVVLENEIVVSFDDVKMKDFREYWQAVAKGDWQKQDTFFAKVVKAWHFDGDPNQAEAYGNLSLDQFIAVQKAIKQVSAQIGVTLMNDFKS
ncbi:MAG: hypothetical protein Phog2KO_44350 [Phototrophicaceae bacterium]